MGKVKKEIVQYLKNNRFCVLCTCCNNNSRATPVRYWSDNLKIIILSEKFTAKFKFLEKNPNVSLGIYTARRPLKGLQLWGKADVITHEDPLYDSYLPQEAKKNTKMRAARKVLSLIQIVPNKITMLDQSRKGNHFLCWEMNKDGKEKEQEIKSLRKVSKL